MPSCGRSWSRPPLPIGSNGSGARAIAVIPRTTGSTRSPAPKPTTSGGISVFSLSLESLRREDVRVDVGDHRIGLIVQQHGCGEPGRGRRGLDSESALPGAPEESRHVRVETVNRQPVRSEAAKAGPAPLDPLDGPVN